MNNLILGKNSNISRTQNSFDKFQMFSSKRKNNDTSNEYSALYNKQMNCINSIYSNLKKYEHINKVGNELLNDLKKKFSSKMQILITKQNFYNEYFKENNNDLDNLNIKIIDDYIINLKEQINLIENKNFIVKKIINDNIISIINVDNKSSEYYDGLSHLISSLSQFKNNTKIKKNYWNNTNISDKQNNLKSNYEENYPLIGENVNLKNKNYATNINNYKDSNNKINNTISVVTDIYISNDDRLYMVINGILYRNDNKFYIVDQRHLYEIQNPDLKKLIIDKINISEIPSIFSLDKSNVCDISSINIKKLYRVHWNNFPGYYNQIKQKFHFLAPITKYGAYDNTFHKYMANSYILRKNVCVSVCTGIITSVEEHPKNKDLTRVRITYCSNGTIKKNNNVIKSENITNKSDIFYQVNKWVKCIIPVENKAKSGDAVIVINSIFQKNENSDKSVKFNTQICSSVLTIGSINVAKTIEKSKGINNSKIYIPNFNQNVICSFKPFKIKKIIDRKIYIDISTVSELELNEWQVDTKNWKNQPFKINETINITFTKNKNGTLNSQIDYRGY